MFNLKAVDGQINFEANNATTDDLMSEFCFGAAYALSRIASGTGIAPEQLAAGLMFNLPDALRAIVEQESKPKEEKQDAIKRN